MKCVKCGHMLSQDGDFCSYCGAKIEHSPHRGKPNKMVYSPYDTPDKRSTKTTLRLVSALIVAFVVIVALCVAMFTRNGSKDELKKNSTIETTDSNTDEPQTTPAINAESAKEETVATGKDIYNQVSVSTVEISAGSDYASNLGSGFYIDTQGTVVTNYHVIEGCSSASVIASNGVTYDVTKVLGYSKELDIAILSTFRQNSEPVEIATDKVVTGEYVYAIGSSQGLTGTFSDGVVSSASRLIDGIEYIQISVPISHGNSGGPLVNAKGQVVGITSAGLDAGQNLNFAIPIATIDQISLDEPISMAMFYRNCLESMVGSGRIAVRMFTITDEFTANFIYELCKYAKYEASSIDIEDMMIIDILRKYSASQDGGDFHIIVEGDFPDEVNQWCFAPERKVGDLDLIEHSEGYTICYISCIGNEY